MSPTLIERVTNIFATEEQSAEKTYRRAVESGNVKAEDLAAAMRMLGKSPGDLAREQNEFSQRKQWAEAIKAIPGLQEAVDRHGAAQRKSLEEYQDAHRVLQAKLAEASRLESLANAELQTALVAKRKLIEGRPEYSARIAELREIIERAKCRLTDLRAAIETAEKGLAFCRDAMKHPARPLDEKTIIMANLLFGSALPGGEMLPNVTITLEAAQVERVFNSLTVSLADCNSEKARLEATIKAGEKELAQLEAAQLAP